MSNLKQYEFMERRSLITVIASALMILAFITLPVISVSGFGFSATMWDMLMKNSSIMYTLLLLLMLLTPIYLILDVYREKMSFMEKIKISSKIASLIPIICFIILAINIATGKGVTPNKGSGYYIYALAAIVVAALPFIKHPSPEK